MKVRPEAPCERTANALAALEDGLRALRRLAIIPALNEAASIGTVIEEIRQFDPGFEIVVIDDASRDATAAVATAHGAHVVELPFNLGTVGAVDRGFR